MGSVLRSSVLIKALRKKYNKAQFIYITTQGNRSIVERMNCVEEVLSVSDSSFWALLRDITRLIFRLWIKRPDLYFDLEVYSAFSTIIAFLSGSRNRYGFYKDMTMFRKGLLTHLVYFNVSRHITTIYLELVKACGIISTDAEMADLDLREEDRKQYRDWFEQKGIDPKKKYIVINPNASDLLYERRWPAGYYALLIEALGRQWKGTIFLVGSEEEKGYVDSILKKCSADVKKSVINTAGAISLLSVFALIDDADLMITNDSGLYHVAVNLSTPLLSLWGPGDPQHYGGGSGSVDKILQDTSFYCSPCLYKIESPPCRGNNLCMKALPPFEVYCSVCELLGIPAGEDVLLMKEEYEKQYQRDAAVSLFQL